MTTSIRDDTRALQAVIAAADVAALVLDADLRLRFASPATVLLGIASSEPGQPIADCADIAVIDPELAIDARVAIGAMAPPVDRDIRTADGRRLRRRIATDLLSGPDAVGLVVTYRDMTEEARLAASLDAARDRADTADIERLRFLNAATHDLRQPLQTLTLLHGMLAKRVENERDRRIAAKIDEALILMARMLDGLVSVTPTEGASAHATLTTFPINDILTRLDEEFRAVAGAMGLDLRVVPCHVPVHSDRHLLEQMIRNLLANALRYTTSGKVLLGCRRRQGSLRVELIDTGTGTPDPTPQSAPEDRRQSEPFPRGRNRGLGLGLSSVRWIGNLLGHDVRVTARPRSGSVFSIEILLPRGEGNGASAAPAEVPAAMSGAAVILVVEDDPEVRDLLELFLSDEGYRVETAADGVAAMDLVERGVIRPDLILTDYNLPAGFNGFRLTAKLRERLGQATPVIVLTGFVSAGSIRDTALQNCIQMSKPVRLSELASVIERVLPVAAPPAPSAAEAVAAAGPDRDRGAVAADAAGRASAEDTTTPVVYIVDDNRLVRDALRAVIEDEGWEVKDYATCEAFLADDDRPDQSCLLIDAYLPGMKGMELLRVLGESGRRLPSIMITGNSDVPMAVEAMKAGAADFIEKPISHSELIASIERALELARDSGKASAWRETAAHQVADLSPRQRQIMEMVLAGHPSKNIAADLGISQRTVENHRASIMRKTGAKSLPALARLALTAGWTGIDNPLA